MSSVRGAHPSVVERGDVDEATSPEGYVRRILTEQEAVVQRAERERVSSELKEAKKALRQGRGKHTRKVQSLSNRITGLTDANKEGRNDERIALAKAELEAYEEEHSEELEREKEVTDDLERRVETLQATMDLLSTEITGGDSDGLAYESYTCCTLNAMEDDELGALFGLEERGLVVIMGEKVEGMPSKHKGEFDVLVGVWRRPEGEDEEVFHVLVVIECKLKAATLVPDIPKAVRSVNFLKSAGRGLDGRDYSEAKLVYMVAAQPEKVLRPKDVYSTLRHLAGDVDQDMEMEARVALVMEQFAEMYITEWGFEDGDGVVYDSLESHIQYAIMLLNTRSIFYLPWPETVGV